MIWRYIWKNCNSRDAICNYFNSHFFSLFFPPAALRHHSKMHAIYCRFRRVALSDVRTNAFAYALYSAAKNIRCHHWRMGLSHDGNRFVATCKMLNCCCVLSSNDAGCDECVRANLLCVDGHNNLIQFEWTDRDTMQYIHTVQYWTF